MKLERNGEVIDVRECHAAGYIDSGWKPYAEPTKPRKSKK